jgi:hypothetical protein
MFEGFWRGGAWLSGVQASVKMRRTHICIGRNTMSLDYRGELWTTFAGYRGYRASIARTMMNTSIPAVLYEVSLDAMQTQITPPYAGWWYAHLLSKLALLFRYTNTRV